MGGPQVSAFTPLKREANAPLQNWLQQCQWLKSDPFFDGKFGPLYLYWG